MFSVFPKVPLEFGDDGDRSLKILKEANYIAKTMVNAVSVALLRHQQRRWRIVENTMTYKLAEKNKLEDTSWIKPGLASWEWWNGATPYGPDVDFVAGCNLNTYKYFIDFASRYGISYIIMDEAGPNRPVILILLTRK